MGNLNLKLMNVINDVTTFITDETANVGKYSYKYLSLSKLLKELKPVFAKHELGFYQTTTEAHQLDRTIVSTVETWIFDEDDEKLICSYPITVTGDPQALGSAVTYARRYSLFAVLGIYPDKDDDGYQAKTRYDNADSGISQQEASQLVQMSKNAGLDLMQIASQVTGRRISRLREISKTEAAQIRQVIEGAK